MILPILYPEQYIRKYRNDKPIPDVTTTVSSYDRMVQTVAPNDSHVHESKDINTNNRALNEKQYTQTISIIV